MNLVQFYQQTPVKWHSEMIVSGDRLYFDGEEYIITGIDEELRLVRSEKELKERLARIEDKVAKLLTK